MNRHEKRVAGNSASRLSTSTPIQVREGNTKLKIYRGRCKKNGKCYPLFTLCYYEGGIRRRQTFADVAAAKAQAELTALRLERGHRSVLKLTDSEQQVFALASRELEPFGVPLIDAIRQYVAATRALPPGASILEAAREYHRRHKHAVVGKPVAEVVDEFFRAKKQDGVSEVYLRTLRYHLNPLRERFKTLIGNITSQDLDEWLRGLGHSARTRKNAAVSLTTLFRFARSHGYLPKDVPTEAEGVSRPKTRSGSIGILTVRELQAILEAANTLERKIYFALGAFTGIRAAELARLEWKNIDLHSRHVEISADKAKTASRRLVPICDALYEWLFPHSGRKGRLFASQRSAERLVQWAGEIIGHWPNNALRHSFISYRVALTQNVAQTALEAGTSPAMIFANYRELVTQQAAERWFSIAPAAEYSRIVPIKGAA